MFSGEDKKKKKRQKDTFPPIQNQGEDERNQTTHTAVHSVHCLNIPDQKG